LHALTSLFRRIKTLPCVIILKLICLFVMFQGERASCYSCTADRVFVVLSVKYDWKISMSLCDLWNLWARFFLTLRQVCATIHCSVPLTVLFHVCAIFYCSVQIAIFFLCLRNIALFSSNRKYFFISAQYCAVQFQSQYFYVCALLHFLVPIANIFSFPRNIALFSSNRNIFMSAQYCTF